VAHQVADSVGFFQTLFDQKLAVPTLRVTGIEGLHGQSFDGFLQLSSRSLAQHGPGAGELFRAHEVAHQWWGHLVGPATYRDAWLGESFAEYSAMMYVEAAMKDDGKTFQKILHAYSDELTGSIQSGFSEFSNPAVNLLNRAKGDRIGPIGFGWRASTGEVPSAYSSLLYSKGPLVLHMLRTLLRDQAGSDQVFQDILRDFARTWRGGYASTSDFAAAVARHAPGDWSWFFDQWIDHTAIPSYRWSWSMSENMLILKVRQSDVPDGFHMPVPVRIEDADGTVERRVVNVTKAEETFSLALPRAPKGVVFDPDVAVLAKVKKD
jgi:aminopeptidase N